MQATTSAAPTMTLAPAALTATTGSGPDETAHGVCHFQAHSMRALAEAASTMTLEQEAALLKHLLARFPGPAFLFLDQSSSLCNACMLQAAALWAWVPYSSARSCWASS